MADIISGESKKEDYALSTQDHIKDLQAMLESYRAQLKKAEDQISELKNELATAKGKPKEVKLELNRPIESYVENEIINQAYRS